MHNWGINQVDTWQKNAVKILGFAEQSVALTGKGF